MYFYFPDLKIKLPFELLLYVYYEKDSLVELLVVQESLHKLNNDNNYLDRTIHYYAKGFQLKQDYYNAINAAFMLYKKATWSKSQNKERDDRKLKADYIRNSVLEITPQLESESNFLEFKDAILVFHTIVETYNYKMNEGKRIEYEDIANELAE